MNDDPLLVINPKLPCPHCQVEPKAIPEGVECQACGGTGRKPVYLGKLWSPSAAFLVCGGPSVNKMPFHRLRERGVVSLAVNNIAGHVPVSAWVFSDPQSKFHHGNFLDPKLLTFAPIGKLKRKIRAKFPDGSFRSTRTRVQDCPGTVGFARRTVFDAKTFLTTPYAHWGRGGKQPDNDRPFTCLCTMLLGIRLLHYLGCPRVYMLGVDFNMTEEAQYAFGQRCSARNGRYSKENAYLAELKPHFDVEGFSLFNCNPESHCDVFPQVKFEDAIDDCKGGVPDEPFDLSEWYSKGLAKEHEEKYPGQVSIGRIAEVQKEARLAKAGEGKQA